MPTVTVGFITNSFKKGILDIQLAHTYIAVLQSVKPKSKIMDYD